MVSAVNETLEIPDYVPSSGPTRVIINGNAENGGSPVYHRHFGTIETDNIGRVHVMYRRALGHATYFEGGIYGLYLEHNGQQRSSEKVIVAPVAGKDISDPRLTRLPDGDMLLIWQELPITSPGVVGTPVVLKAKLSSDNCATWGAEYTIFTCSFSYCRMFGDVKVIQNYGVGGSWRLALTAYYRVSSSPNVLRVGVLYSDDGKTWTEGNPIYEGTIQYNETAVAWAGASVGIAVMRVNPDDGLYISRTTTGGGSWTTPVKLTGVETNAVAPSLEVITHNGVQYFLLGYCDRASNSTKWRWDTVTRCLSTNAAFTYNLRTTSAADMIEASGYQTGKIFPTGQMLFAEFKEYAYSPNISGPVGTDVRLVYANPAGWVAGEEQSFTPTIAGSTTPGTPVYAVNGAVGTIKKADNGHVTGIVRIALTSKGGMNGQLRISLPYPNKGGARYRSGGIVTYFGGVDLANYGVPYVFIDQGSSTIDLWRSNAAGTDTAGLANITAAQVSDTFSIDIRFDYFTDV